MQLSIPPSRDKSGAAIIHCPGHGIWMIDFLKALASQLIVWHHFASYGPLIKTVRPYAPNIVDWLFVDARMAVQAFLVVGGFLAARSLAPHIDISMDECKVKRLASLLGRRYLRLCKPYCVALGLAIVCAAIARSLLFDPDTPAPPSLQQILFHALLIHDITRTEALTTGAWYVAADLQLYALLLVLLWLAEKLSIRFNAKLAATRSALILGVAALSLFWANRDPAMEVWAIYFFADYALGVMTIWSCAAGNRWLSFVCLLLYALAATIDFRERLLISLLVSVLMFFGKSSSFCPRTSFQVLIAWLSRISYWVFLIHYPIVMVVGVAIERLWPGAPLQAILGLFASWALTLLLAQTLYGIKPQVLLPALLIWLGKRFERIN